jgi:hypothetical protein
VDEGEGGFVGEHNAHGKGGGWGGSIESSIAGSDEISALVRWIRECTHVAS